jgi:hypothetical protein
MRLWMKSWTLLVSRTLMKMLPLPALILPPLPAPLWPPLPAFDLPPLLMLIRMQ